MTLDIKALLRNLLKKQMSIQHFTAKHEVFRVDAIPSKIKSKIQEEFGENYLLDADYIVFFRGKMTSDQIEKLYNLTNKAFGEDANRLVEGDFKRISFDDGSAPSKSEEVDDQSIDDQAEVDDNTPADDGSTTPLDEEVKKILSEGKDSAIDAVNVTKDTDESNEPLDEDVQIDPSVNAYLFLKITTK